MRLNNQELFDFFVEKEILALYHANTVTTSITYFQNGGLLSRGAVEKANLLQTPQTSDEIDKVLNVWNDVFLDTSDLHTFFGRENHYGPILFELNRDLILDENLEIWITKNNPIYWKPDTALEKRYFQSVTELSEKWDSIERQRKMITIRNNNSPILFDYIRRIIVDDPKRMILIDGISRPIFNIAQQNIKNVISNNNQLRGKFITRECGYCWCISNYLNQRSENELKRLFL